MKKLVFGLIAMVLFSFVGNAQDFTKEEARVNAAKVLINFKSTLVADFNKSRTFEDFIKNVTGPYNPTTIPAEGKDLLRVTYDYLSRRTSDKEILTTYSGKEIANAFRFLKNNPEKDESQLFGFVVNGKTNLGGKGGPSVNFEIFESEYPCKWYQIRCHLQQIFGEKAGDKLTDALITAIILLF